MVTILSARSIDMAVASWLMEVPRALPRRGEDRTRRLETAQGRAQGVGRTRMGDQHALRWMGGTRWWWLVVGVGLVIALWRDIRSWRSRKPPAEGSNE